MCAVLAQIQMFPRSSFPGGRVKTHKPQWIPPTFPLGTPALTHAVRTMRNTALPVLSLCLSLHLCGQHEAASGMINSEGGRSWRGPLPGWWKQHVLSGLWNSNDTFHSVSRWWLWKFPWKGGGGKEERQKHGGGGGEAAGEQRGEISAVPKIDDSVEPKKDAKGESKGIVTRSHPCFSLRRIAQWLFLSLRWYFYHTVYFEVTTFFSRHVTTTWKILIINYNYDPFRVISHHFTQRHLYFLVFHSAYYK